jgi:hypothetical protein
MVADTTGVLLRNKMPYAALGLLWI